MAYKDSYYAAPSTQIISTSNEMVFKFYENPVLVINDVEYPLSDGIMINYGDFEGKGIYNHSMYLLSPDHIMNWETLESTGTGAVVDFEIFNTNDTIESGIYPFSIPEDMNTVKVCDSIDRNADGLINDDDCIYTMPDGEFYISSRISVYDTNVNLQELIGLKFRSGNIAINREDDQYRIELDCVGENGDIITGFYMGSLHYYDFSNE